MERALVLSGGGARGAFQVGVIKYLDEIGWKPDIISGTSIGAIIACAMASGLNASDLEALWKDYRRANIYQPTLPKFLKTLFSRRQFHPLLDTRPLRRMLEQNLDIGVIRRNPMRVVITAINICTSQVEYFDNETIQIEHVMASSAMPGLFPWQRIGQSYYWDSGLMANTPIIPALRSGAKDIIVALLSPIGAFPLGLPETHWQVQERVFEQFLTGSYLATPWDQFDSDIRIRLVAPRRTLGLLSIMNFSGKFVRSLIQEGYENAGAQLV